MKKFRLLLAIIIIVFAWGSLYYDLTKDPNLIDEINFSPNPSNMVEELYLSEKYEDNIYMCLGSTVSNGIYVGYIQIVDFGITHRPQESLFFKPTSMFRNTYYCMGKTEEEGKFYFGFVKEKDIDSVNINGQKIRVEYFQYPDNSEDVFGFWYLKEDWDYSINDFSYNQLGKSE